MPLCLRFTQYPFSLSLSLHNLTISFFNFFLLQIFTFLFSGFHLTLQNSTNFLLHFLFLRLLLSYLGFCFLSLQFTRIPFSIFLSRIFIFSFSGFCLFPDNSPNFLFFFFYFLSFRSWLSLFQGFTFSFTIYPNSFFTFSFSDFHFHCFRV